MPLREAGRPERDAVEGVADNVEVPLALAIEELEAELRLWRLHLVADRSLSDEQLLGRAREALMTGRGLEGLQRIERRQSARHRLTPTDSRS